MSECTTTAGAVKRGAPATREQKGPAGQADGALLPQTRSELQPVLMLRQRDWKVIGSAIQTGTFLSRLSAGRKRKTLATRMAAWSSPWCPEV